jgi:hypothetical protein
MFGKRFILAIIILVLLIILLFIFADPVQSTHQISGEVTLTIVGRVVNTQGSAVEEAEVQVVAGSDQSTTLVTNLGVEGTFTDSEGFYIAEVQVPAALIKAGSLHVEITKAGFRMVSHDIVHELVATSGTQCFIRIPDLT